METERIPAAADLMKELVFITSRSGGPGGQNVNKVSTKVTLRFDVQASMILNQQQKDTILQKLSSRITNEGELLIASQEKRSQLANKEEVISKLDELLKKAFAIRKARKSTRPGKSAVAKRINSKKLLAQKKQWRQKPL